MDEQIGPTEDQKYCEKESDQAYETIARSQDEYDKQLLTLSTGFLAVLVAFLKDVVHLQSAVDRPLLYLGLAGLGLTILLVIVSFQMGIYALERVRKYYKRRYRTGEAGKFPKKWSKRVKKCNWTAGLAFILGISLIIAFIVLNLAHQ